MNTDAPSDRFERYSTVTLQWVAKGLYSVAMGGVGWWILERVDNLVAAAALFLLAALLLTPILGPLAVAAGAVTGLAAGLVGAAAAWLKPSPPA